MPAAFQKVMHYTLVGVQNTHCFLDDIIIVSRLSKEEHLKLVYKCLKKLDEDNLRINLSKCHFSKTEIELLGHKFTQSGFAPPESKTAAILSLSAPKNLNQLRSFLGSVHYLGKFIPNYHNYGIHFGHYLKRTQNVSRMTSMKLISMQLKIAWK